MKPQQRLRRVIALLICLLAGLHAAQAQTAPAAPGVRISKIVITHVGPPAASDDLIRANIHIKEGDSYQRTSSDDDVQNLYKTGYFYNIRVTQDLGADGVILTFYLQRNPQLTGIKFEGNKKLSEKKLLKLVKSKPGEPLKEAKLFADKQAIEKEYQSKGYPRTDVQYRLNIDENTGKGSATFEIKEGSKIKIGDIRFEGAEVISQRKLRGSIKTKRWWIFSWITSHNVLKDEQLQEDKESLAEYYRRKGYIDFDLQDVKVVNTAPNQADLIFKISEGRQYKVGAINYTGEPIYNTNDITKRLDMKVGDTFTPQGLAVDAQGVEDFYGRRGHLQANPRDGGLRVFKQPNIDTGTMDLEFKLEPGPTNYVERIDIAGNWKTKDRVLRRELAIAPGDIFNTAQMKLSVRRLEQLDYFEKVDARIEDTGVPDRKNLSITVEEKSTGNFTVGAGFSSVDSIVGFAELTQGNFDLMKFLSLSTPTGAGQKIRVRTQLGLQRQDYEVQFTEPWFLGRKLAFDTYLYHRDLSFESLGSLYDRTTTGARFGLTRTLGSDFLIGGISYTIEDIGIIPGKNLHGPEVGIVDPGPPPVFGVIPGNAPQAILDERGHALLSRFGASISYNTLNDVKLPNKGQLTELTSEYVGGFLGGDKSFYKLGLHTAWYFPGLAKGHILEVGAVGEVAESLDNQPVPFYERYYLGGMSDLRGWRYREISPREPGFKEPVGGNTSWFGSAEYSIPIIDMLRVAVFYDIGNVSSEAYDFNAKDFADDWGLGLRLNLPIGPLRLDYGIPIHSPPGVSDRGRFQFGVGYKRQF